MLARLLPTVFQIYVAFELIYLFCEDLLIVFWRVLIDMIFRIIRRIPYKLIRLLILIDKFILSIVKLKKLPKNRSLDANQLRSLVHLT